MIKKNNIEAIHDGANHHTIHDSVHDTKHDAGSSWAEGLMIQPMMRSMKKFE